MEEDKKVKYAGYDDIIFQDKDDISYYKSSQEFEIAQGLLLGNYDDDGKYYIPEELCKELVKIDKIIDETVGNIYYVSAKVGDYKLKFEILVEEKDDKKAGFLYLIENYKLQNIIEKKFKTLIASYVDDNDINFLFRMKKEFNIWANVEAEGKEMSNLSKASLILARKKQLLELRTKLYYNRDNLDKQYVKQILKILKVSGPTGKRVLLMYLDLVRTKNLNKLKVNKYVMLRQALDICLDRSMVEGYFPNKDVKSIRILRNSYMKKAKDLQNEFSKASGSKSSSKSKSSGGKKTSKSKSSSGSKAKPKVTKKASIPNSSINYTINQSKNENVEDKKSIFPPIIGLRQENVHSKSDIEMMI